MEEKREARNVVSGEVKTKNVNVVNKIFGMFLAEDLGTIWDYLKEDVIFPKLVDGIYDVVIQAANSVFYGTGRSTTHITRNNNPEKYSNISKKSSTTPSKPAATFNFKEQYNSKEIILSTRADAEAVRNELLSIIHDFGFTTVADLYRAVGQESTYSDYNFGWTDLTRASISHVREGWLLRMPKAIQIE